MNIPLVFDDHLFLWPIKDGEPKVHRLDASASWAQSLGDNRVLLGPMNAPPYVSSIDGGDAKIVLGSGEAFAVAVHNKLDLIATYDGPNVLAQSGVGRR